MNAQLLTVSPNTASAKSGIGALLSNASGAKVKGASFEDFLEKQSDAVDSELVEMLGSLGLEPKELKDLAIKLKELGSDLSEKDQQLLMSHLKELGVSLPQLNKVTQFLKSADDLKSLAIKVKQPLEMPTQAKGEVESKSKVDIKTDTNGLIPLSKDDIKRADFISATLFIANESKAIRSSAVPISIAKLDKETARSERFTLAPKAGGENHERLDLRFDLKSDPQTKQPTVEVAGSKKAAPVLNLSNAASNQVEEDMDVFASNANLNTTATNSTALPFNELTGLTTLSNAASPTSTPPAFTPAYSTQIVTSLTESTQWSTDFGRVMVQMSQQAGQGSQTGLQSAEIRLNPAELGPIRIMLSINEGVANAMIFAAHAQTRQAIEQSFPQLQQQLAQSGLSLGEASVSDQSFPSQAQDHPHSNKEKNAPAFSLNPEGQVLEEDAKSSANTRVGTNSNAIIDTFA